MASGRRKKQAPLRGYTKLPGTAKHWRTPSGVEITDYEYRSRRAKRVGWKNYSEVERYHRSQPFLRIKFDVITNESNYKGKGKSRRYVGPSLSYDSQLVRDSFTANDDAKRRRKRWMRTPGVKHRMLARETPLGRLLIAMGRMDYDAEIGSP